MRETEHLNIHAATQEEMESFIAAQENEVLKCAYTEMLEGCLTHPELWEWYAIWMIEIEDGTHVGELCFKGIKKNGTVEIGYGISEKYRGLGYATEAVTSLVNWAFEQPGICAIQAEVEKENHSSKRVLEKCGFVFTGKWGEEGPIYLRKKNMR